MATHRVVKLFAVCMLGSASASANPGVTQPRTLGSGRPACGNVVGKGERVVCEPAAITAQQRAPAAVIPPIAAIQPRTLPSGRPACSNVVGKSAEPPPCTAAVKPVTRKPPKVARR